MADVSSEEVDGPQDSSIFVHSLPDLSMAIPNWIHVY